MNCSSYRTFAQPNLFFYGFFYYGYAKSCGRVRV